jgi:hypothetical protein
LKLEKRKSQASIHISRKMESLLKRRNTQSLPFDDEVCGLTKVCSKKNYSRPELVAIAAACGIPGYPYDKRPYKYNMKSLCSRIRMMTHAPLLDLPTLERSEVEKINEETSDILQSISPKRFATIKQEIADASENNPYAVAGDVDEPEIESIAMRNLMANLRSGRSKEESIQSHYIDAMDFAPVAPPIAVAVARLSTKGPSVRSRDDSPFRETPPSLPRRSTKGPSVRSRDDSPFRETPPALPRQSTKGPSVRSRDDSPFQEKPPTLPRRSGSLEKKAREYLKEEESRQGLLASLYRSSIDDQVIPASPMSQKLPVDLESLMKRRRDAFGDDDDEQEDERIASPILKPRSIEDIYNEAKDIFLRADRKPTKDVQKIMSDLDAAIELENRRIRKRNEENIRRSQKEDEIALPEELKEFQRKKRKDDMENEREAKLVRDQMMEKYRKTQKSRKDHAVEVPSDMFHEQDFSGGGHRRKRSTRKRSTRKRSTRKRSTRKRSYRRR